MRIEVKEWNSGRKIQNPSDLTCIPLYLRLYLALVHSIIMSVVVWLCLAHMNWNYYVASPCWISSGLAGRSASLCGWALKCCPVRKSQCLLVTARSRCRLSAPPLPPCLLGCSHASCHDDNGLRLWSSEAITQLFKYLALLRVAWVMLSITLE